MQLLRHIFTLYHSDQNAGGGGTAVATPPDPGAAGGAGPAGPGTVPGDQGQAGGEGIWNNFPEVPQEHRAIVEPHLRKVMGHATQLEQQLAPFKPFLDSGLDAQTAAGILAFNQKFDQNPLQTWLDLGKHLQQQQGQGGRMVVDPDVDLDYLSALARGEDPDAGQTPAAGTPGAGPPQDQNADGWTQREMQLYQMVQGLQTQLQQTQEGLQQDRVTQQQRVMDRLHANKLGQMREELIKAGYAKEQLSDEVLNAHVLTARGRFDVATKMLVDHRNAILQGSLTPQNQPAPTELPNGAPASPSRQKPSRRDNGDPFKSGTKAAEARLKRLNAPG